jgi:hypothetical protein
MVHLYFRTSIAALLLMSIITPCLVSYYLELLVFCNITLVSKGSVNLRDTSCPLTKFALELLALGDLSHRLVEVVLVHRIPVVLDGEETRLSDHVPQISAIEAVAHLHHRLEVDLALLLHTRRVDLQYLQSACLVGQRNLDLPVQATGSEQGGVERIGSVGCHDDLGLSEVVETVELVEKFHECSLDFTIGGCTLGETATTDGIDFVHEDDAGLVFLCVSEHLADETCGLSDVLVDDGG